MNNRLWIFTELFYPDETSTAFILTKISNKLATKYKNINVVCANKNIDDVGIKNELKENINVKRVKTIFNNKASLISRSLRFLEISFKFFLILIFVVKKREKIFIVTNPAPLILLVSVVKKIKKLEVIVLVHDVFPENALYANIIKSENSFQYVFLKKIYNIAYGNMNKLIVIGRDMKDIVQKKIEGKNKVEIVIIENWGETDKIFPIPKQKTENKIIFQYAGNIGRVQGLKELFLIISKIKNKSIFFEIIGNGVEKNKLINYVKENNLENIEFKNSYSRDEQNFILNNADVCMITLSKGMYGLGVPSKFYNILSAGKPILYIGDKKSEIELVMKENNIGYYFNLDEEDKLLDFFDNLKSKNDFIEKGNNARSLALKFYTEDIILKKFLKEI